MNIKSLPMTPYLLAVIPAVVADAVQKKNVPLKRLLAAFLFGAMVWLLAEWRMDIASAFAWVAALTSLLINGQILFNAVTKWVA
jgi:hypothetical protein